ncbi:MAG: rhamnulose-1-phosphate aldolase [Candidatus Cloacimonetes bacterium]|nr:rhamnulose-1-phosphate aldolase [Candidatus Cloacimonadota bacterium]
MKNILESKFIQEFSNVIDRMYLNGWDERNAGNVSYLLLEEELSPYLDLSKKGRVHQLQIDAHKLAGKYVLVTGSGKYFRNVKGNPEANSCIIRISQCGTHAEILWGLKEGEVPTSELSTHLSSHIARLEVDDTHRVIIHTHATYLNIMSAVVDLDEKNFTKALWGLNTENIIIFPEGIGIIPWEIPGNGLIGKNTANKIKTYKIVLWPLHGVVASGETVDSAFGLIETVEKAAMMYMVINNYSNYKTINDEELIKLASAFKVTPNKEFIK